MTVIDVESQFLFYISSHLLRVLADQSEFCNISCEISVSL